MDGYQLAQINVGRLRAPGRLARSSPSSWTPSTRSTPLAEASPGFVWRFQTEDGNATAVRPYDDDSILVNMSVWTSVEAPRRLRLPLATTPSYLRRRREWFERMTEIIIALVVGAGRSHPHDRGGHRPARAPARQRARPPTPSRSATALSRRRSQRREGLS